jgi:DNA-3-methyladenine glycosylase I
MLEDLVVGDDGLRRCRWGASPPEYRAYHDHEWGRPQADERAVFEILSLEAFQSGLSWLTVLRKREGFREAFDLFDPEVVAGFGDHEVTRILANPEVIRHRGKIVATIDNARATVLLHDQGRSLASLFWRDEPPVVGAPQVLSDIAAETSRSKDLSAELRRHGFKFVGPKTAYAAMQALGIVNDHLGGCAFRAPALAQRRVFNTPADIVDRGP